MLTILRALAIIPIYLISFYMFGALTLRLFREDGSRHNYFLVGFASYFSMFLLVMLPLKYRVVPIYIEMYVWIGIVILVALVNFIWNRKLLAAGIRCSVANFKQCKIAYIAVIIITLLLLIYTELRGAVGSPWDASYYIGEVAQDLRVGYAGICDPYTGNKLTNFAAAYFCETYLMHSDVMCTLFHLPAAVEMRTSWLAVVEIIYVIIIWELVKALFRGISWKQPLILLLMLLIQWLCIPSNMQGIFILTRGFEGKNILANVVMTTMLLCFIRLFQAPDRGTWALLFTTILMSFSFSMSAIFILPIYYAAFGVVYMIYRHKWNAIWSVVVCALPCLIFAGFYYGTLRGVISLPINL